MQDQTRDWVKRERIVSLTMNEAHRKLLGERARQSGYRRVSAFIRDAAGLSCDGAEAPYCYK
jgi:hypothetical protein